MDVEKIRADFPVLKTGVIYLDNSATSLTPEPVVEEMCEYYRTYRASVHRGLHRLSLKASERYEGAHRKVGEFIGAGEREVVFTKNTTEGINLVAGSLGLKRGDKVITSAIEHHSNLLPWMRLRKDGVEVELVYPDEEWKFNLGELEKKIDEKTKIVALTHLSNMLGVINPVEEIGKIVKESGALFLVDGAQSAPHIPIDVKKINCDFFAFSAHKMLGPTGIGALYIRGELAESLEPAFLGGGTINEVSASSFELTKSPDRWEAGTPNIAEAIGFAKAVEYLEKIGMGEIAAHEKKLTKIALEGLGGIGGVEIYGPLKGRAGVISFNVRGMNPHDVSSLLDEMAGIATRSGHHCAMPLTAGVLKQSEGTVRASHYVYNTGEEIGKLVETVGKISKIV